MAAERPAGASAVRFSTRGLPAPERIGLWEDHNARALIALRCRTLDTQSLDATEINLQVGQLHLARVVGSPHIVERTTQVIRGNPADAVACYLTLKGEAFFYHDDGVRVVGPGELIVCDADRPFVRGFSHGLEELAIRIPRAAFAELGSGETVRSPIVKNLDDGDLHGRTLRRVVARAVRQHDPQPVEESLVLGLVRSVLRGGADDVGAVHLATAQAYVNERLDDADLSVPKIAAAVGLSPRHLSRVFAAAGTSVPRYVRQRRLERARALLERSPDRSLSELAAECGFVSATYFSHAFREHFGVRATDVRREARLRLRR